MMISREGIQALSNGPGRSTETSVAGVRGDDKERFMPDAYACIFIERCQEFTGASRRLA